MKVLLSWLREFAPIEGSPDEIADQLTALGMELESVTRFGDGLDGVVVARVLDVRPHPDADRIRLVDVDAGDGEALQICCGADNMTAGDLVPLATIGTTLPGGVQIAQRRMRGELSNGMLCSATELELGEDASGILLLGDHLAPGTPLSEALALGGDVAYEFDALPNRPDTLSVLGVARDLAAHQRVELVEPAVEVAEAGDPASGRCDVELLDPGLCGRFHVRVLSGVGLGPSPPWLARRLLACGMRPINAVVDVSNYVMLELGQPNHTYDLATLPGGVLRVRRARADERIVTLDGVERRLDERDGVIADRDDGAVGVAGVMGGAATEISESTTDVLVEAAWWDPASVAATSSRLGLHSEASLRFKRGVDPEVAPRAVRRVAELLGQISGATLHPGAVERTGVLPDRPRVRVRPARVNALLGTELTGDEMRDLLTPIGFASAPDRRDAPAAGGTDGFEVVVPSWRPDSSVEVDVIEEIARHHGYESLPRTVPASPHSGGLTPRQRDRRALRRALVGAGVSEAMPMPFLAPGDLERCGLPPDGLVLANPLVAEESVLRTSLLPGLLAAVAHNERHRTPRVSLFEVGRVFAVGDGVVTDVEASERTGRVLDGESEHLAAALAGREAADSVRLAELLAQVAGRGPLSLRAGRIDGLHPGRSAEAVVADRVVGEVGEVDPVVLDRLGIDERVAWVRFDLDELLGLAAPVAHERPVSRFPSTDLDLAFVVPVDLPAAEVRASITDAAGDLLVDQELFDVFRSDQLGPDRRSLAFRLRLQADDRTLTDAEVGAVRERVVAAVGDRHGAVLRG